MIINKKNQKYQKSNLSIEKPRLNQYENDIKYVSTPFSFALSLPSEYFLLIMER